MTDLSLLESALLDDLLDHLLVDVGTELVVESLMGSSVHLTLCSVSISVIC